MQCLHADYYCLVKVIRAPKGLGVYISRTILTHNCDSAAIWDTVTVPFYADTFNFRKSGFFDIEGKADGFDQPRAEPRGW